ncbi:FtsW/RodA/SpoVE family cell cycle protein [Paenibacillus sp. MZ03-122A]|uniref:FtsW/RodA/SpoVE family cell cycle protein n=1 Tax=Paenibacillus sp. MZ03-122A TaxID=2962033 RepID=UPI0020B8268E|nr:FtsW/RodA/SpoVE family cell cycle protein [Paenibacillus sp. MZ03-122A]MCP3778008.1 FtsW/RodA/SpoVE family cell cycle protein [Paenibacillus sp. MZ03-122A]
MLQKLKKIDGPVIFILILLMAISIVTVYSAGRAPTNLPDHGNDYQRMIGYYILGFVAILGLAIVDFRIFIKKALYVYGGGIFLLGLGFFGGTVNNSQGFLKIGGLNLQPAEVFKLVLIIFLTYMLIKKRKSKLYFIQDVLPVALVSFVPFAMVMAQNDLGNALGYIVIVIGMLWIGNVKASHALIGFIVFAVAVGGGIKAYISFHDEIDSFMKGIGRSHWVERLDPWLVPEEATAKASYHTKNAKLAIASGGMMGKGFLQGTSVQSGRVPYTYADSIFVVVAEEFGFVGSSALLLLYFILIHRMILISLECRDRAGPYIIVGIVSMLLYQIFENIGAFLGIMPLTGITLPFISYGGTSLLINMASIGLVMSIKVHGQELEDDLPQPSRVSLRKAKKA